VQGPNWFNEPDWLASENPHHLLAILERQEVKGGRKFRLAASACCRLVGDRLPDPLREAIEISERYADRKATYEELRSAAKRCRAAPGHSVREMQAALEVLHREPRMGAGGAVYHLLGCGWGGPRLDDHPPQEWWQPGIAWSAAARAMAHIIRDIFGNPFRRPSVDRSWLTPTVTNLAAVAYEERALPSGELDAARLAVLGDALEEAGCSDADVIGHLRSPGPHVRGCWPLDLVLGEA
jgi:hypothetical protein